MVSALDIDPRLLISKAAQKLEEMNIEKPAFVGFVKSGAHADRPPENANFWYIRCASILRQAYANTLVGTNRLRRHYGGAKDRGVRPSKHKMAGGSTIRKALQTLEKHGMLKKGPKGKGRELTAKGRQLLDGAAKEITKTA